MELQALDAPKKGISVFDFDDTLARTKEKVIVTSADGNIKEFGDVTSRIQASDLQEQWSYV